MSQQDIQKKILLHNDYWDRKPLKRPLVSFQLEEYFPSKRFRSARHLLTAGKRITPDMLEVDELIEDYERMYQAALSTGQDGFWVAEPFNGIPWMEAIFGCEVFGTESSFISHPSIKSMGELRKIEFDTANPWFKKYMEFVDKLSKFSAGRFPIGQPIMRGASDIVGALLGQTELIYALVEESEAIQEAFFKVMTAFEKVIKMQLEAIPDFHGGYSMGFYHVWCPEKCIWFQEDVSSLLSPQMYNDFLLEPDTAVCKDYNYTAVHLHPVSFFIIDSLMQIDRLKAIQINKDFGGPSVKEMIPTMQKVLTKKNLIIYGDLDEADIDCIAVNLPKKGVFLNLFAPTDGRARELMDYVGKVF